MIFNRDLKKDLDPTVYNKVKERKIRYIRNLNHEKNSKYLTWQETFKTQAQEVLDNFPSPVSVGISFKSHFLALLSYKLLCSIISDINNKTTIISVSFIVLLCDLPSRSVIFMFRNISVPYRKQKR